ncbi:MAG: hypothetical protein KDA80_20520 [Planctomycetaceae bacterium]|nr:hypothetical protein [Planctomycetaceae bacterium]
MIRTNVITNCLGAAMLLLATSCASSGIYNAGMYKGRHGGIKYTIQPDKRMHHVEKGKNGRLTYDSAELVVVAEDERLKINGQDCGPLSEGDHLEITDIGTVLVNGERRGDSMTNSRVNRARLKARQEYVDGLMEYDRQQG